MKFEQFTKFIQACRAFHKMGDTLHKLGIGLDPFIELVDDIQAPLFDSIFNELQRDALDWWLYDSPNGIYEPDPKWAKVRIIATGEDILLHTERQLYDYLMTLEQEA